MYIYDKVVKRKIKVDVSKWSLCFLMYNGAKYGYIGEPNLEWVREEDELTIESLIMRLEDASVGKDESSIQ